LGSGRTRKVDVRIVAASNRDLETEVRSGRFREDLYYRLATLTIRLPSLRERKMDIPILANSLLKTAVKKFDKKTNGFSDEAMACMQAYYWPGNVRELQNEILHMLVMGQDDTLGAELLTPRILRAIPQDKAPELEVFARFQGSLKERVETLEAHILQETLTRNRWNKSRSAEELGLSRVGLRSKLERYGLERASLTSGNAERSRK